MRKEDVKAIIVHCSATRAGQNFSAKDIDRWHKENGWKMIGYHYVIRLDGSVEEGRPVTMSGAHCKGWNSKSIGICYIGGLDIFGKPSDTRTYKQIRAMHELVDKLLGEFPNVEDIFGHRDSSPDLNGDGKISPNEWIKACPCFDVRSEFPLVVVRGDKVKR